jgi:hypothetical protein
MWLVAPYQLVYKLNLPEDPYMACGLPSHLPAGNFASRLSGGYGPQGAISAWPLGSQVVSTAAGYYYACRSRDASTEFMYDQNEG